jgi:hypothetical protein
MTSKAEIAARFLKKGHTVSVALKPVYEEGGRIYYVAKKKRLRNQLRHRLHPMHLYCRICTRYGESTAKRIGICYETYVWRWFKKLIELLPR